MLVEGCEESGSFDLPFYIDKLEDRIGTPSLVVCLDAECGNYDQLWCTTSLRGNLTGTLRVDVLTEGVHSGTASGVVPSSFRTARQLISRIEDESTGQLLLDDLHAEIPEQRLEQAALAAETLQEMVYEKFPWAVDDPRGVHNTFFTIQPYSSPREGTMYFAETWGMVTELIVRAKTTYESPDKGGGGAAFGQVFQHDGRLVN